jgi:hypothetical protein
MDPNETEEGITRKAYLMGMRLKNSGLDQEVIYARLEKAGFPEELVNKVVSDMMIEHKKDLEAAERPFFNVAIVKIGLGILFALVTMIISPGRIFLPIIFIISGVILALASKERMKMK